ncbi:hypothetical protein PHSC3_001888 [Chlamydiales bacterium STE3]|nr:hypothetical protein PHSC3_001888 [Chlamydiales bacterium STE3]
MSLKKMFRKSESSKTEKPSPPTRIIPPNPTTKVVIKYNVGYSNTLFIRGEGAGLNWEKGTPLQNRAEDEWIWETNEIFPSCQYKVLINDTRYENGENHNLRCGSSSEYTPNFF